MNVTATLEAVRAFASAHGFVEQDDNDKADQALDGCDWFIRTRRDGSTDDIIFDGEGNVGLTSADGHEVDDFEVGMLTADRVAEELGLFFNDTPRPPVSLPLLNDLMRGLMEGTL